MQDARKTKAQLIDELNEMRQARVADDSSVTERQLAVERVRSAAMAMNAACDLRQVVAVLFGEIRRLGIDSPAASITFIDEPAKTVTRYGAFVDPDSLGHSRDEPGDTHTGRRSTMH